MSSSTRRYDGSDATERPWDDDRAQGTAVLVGGLLGVAIWAAGWGWDTPFTYVGDVGMFGGPFGMVKLVGSALAIGTVGMVAGLRGLPWAGASGVTVGFGLLWSADALVTYSNAFWVLGVVPMWLLVAADAFMSAWAGVYLKVRVRPQRLP